MGEVGDNGRWEMERWEKWERWEMKEVRKKKARSGTDDFGGAPDGKEPGDIALARLLDHRGKDARIEGLAVGQACCC